MNSEIVHSKLDEIAHVCTRFESRVPTLGQLVILNPLNEYNCAGRRDVKPRFEVYKTT